MNIRKIKAIVALMAVVTVTMDVRADEVNGVFGSYVGLLRNKIIETDQFAKLDFIISREEENRLELKAMLTLYFGDFASKEYITYHFDQVKYDALTGVLVFDQADQELGIKTLTFHQGRLEATVRSRSSGDVGILEMNLNGAVSSNSNPHRPRVEPLWGEYESSSQGDRRYLQLGTYRSSKDTGRNGNPFGAYEIQGQMGQFVSNLCPHPENKSAPCVTNVLTAGTYNFFSGEMTLFGNQKNIFCKIQEEGTFCDGRLYKRISGELKSKATLSPQRSRSFWGTQPVPFLATPTPIPIPIEGEYAGYLHHESMDRYQSGSINLMTYRDSGNSIKISAVARLFFGNKFSSEALAYRFAERSYPVLSSGQFVLERMDSDVDAILQVTSLEAGVIRGVWYSLIYGRVGTFYFSKTEVRIPSSAHVMLPLSGIFEANNLEIMLSTRLGSTPIDTENPYFPMELGGHLFYKRNFSPKIRITGGSFDFYTGRIGIETEEEGRAMIGDIDFQTSSLNLKWGRKAFGALWPQHNVDNFKLINRTE